MAEARESSPPRSQQPQLILPTVLAAGAVAVFAACLLLAVRYPNVPRDAADHLSSTNLFARRAWIAAFGSVIVLVVGTFVAVRWPTRSGVRILILGVPAAALVAAVAMPVATRCPSGTITHDGECYAILFYMVVRGDTSFEIPARLMIVVLGCLGGLYFWLLVRRTERSVRQF